MSGEKELSLGPFILMGKEVFEYVVITKTGDPYNRILMLKESRRPKEFRVLWGRKYKSGKVQIVGPIEVPDENGNAVIPVFGSRNEAVKFAKHIETLWNNERKFKQILPSVQLSSEQQRRLLNACEIVFSCQFPNLAELNGKKHVTDNELNLAIVQDLIAMGFTENGNGLALDLSFSENVLKAKRKRRDPLPIKEWLIRNWYHGCGLYRMKPEQRGAAVRTISKFKTYTDSNISKILSDINLTERRKRGDGV